MELAQLVTLIVATIGLFGNLVVALLSNHRLKSIDQSKRMSELETYRYTKLYDLMESRDELLDKLSGDGFSREIERSQIISKLYHKAKPLVQQKHWGDIDLLFSEIASIKITLIQNTNDINCSPEMINALFEITGKIEERFILAVQSQLQELLNK